VVTRFTLNGRSVTHDGDPMARLLDVLREGFGLTGTKEGCGEGECGACTVWVDHEIVCSCLVPVFQVDGRSVRTIEAIADSDGLDPIQEAFVRDGGAQCGACTPGMLVAARDLLDKHPMPDRKLIREALAGNLCRCTGYEKIFRAVEAAARTGTRTARSATTPRAPLERPYKSPVTTSMTEAHRPKSLADALRLLADPGAVPVAGCTDLMVVDTATRRVHETVVDLFGVPDLAGIRRVNGGLDIGAACTFREIGRDPEVRVIAPSLADAARTIGAWQIQNRATIGGNLANASPAGDSLPVLLALDAGIVLSGPDGERIVPSERFHTGYRETALAEGELIVRVKIPEAAGAKSQRFWKVGTREAQAISKVVVAFAAARRDGGLVNVRLAAGSVAPTPVRLRATERVCEGQVPSAGLASRAADTARNEITPIDDVRSTATYRRHVLGEIVRRMVLDLVDRPPRGA
jgi:carbon-monoxide dehydrogenase small subunit/xanthine dehydrogenase small subunit